MNCPLLVYTIFLSFASYITMEFTIYYHRRWIYFFSLHHIRRSLSVEWRISHPLLLSLLISCIAVTDFNDIFLCIWFSRMKRVYAFFSYSNPNISSNFFSLLCCNAFRFQKIICHKYSEIIMHKRQKERKKHRFYPLLEMLFLALSHSQSLKNTIHIWR